MKTAATFALTLATVLCLVWWPLPTAAMVIAGSGVWWVSQP